MAQLQDLNISGSFLKLPSGTTAERPALPSQGAARVNTDFDPPSLEIYNGSSWQTFSGKYSAGLGLSNQAPAADPDEILDSFPEAPNGLYWYDINGTARQIWTDMEQGGWLLAARFNGSSSTWQHDSSNWTNTGVFNATSNPFTNTDIKTHAWFYNRDGSMKVRWCLGFRHNYLEEWWYNTGGIRGFYADSQAIQTNANFNTATGTRHSRQDFIEWWNKSRDISGTSENSTTGRAYVNGSGSTQWNNCNMRGINMRANSGGDRVRYGITLNNESDCSSNDYEWGIGFSSNRVGNVSAARRSNYTGSSYAVNDHPIGWCFVK